MRPGICICAAAAGEAHLPLCPRYAHGLLAPLSLHARKAETAKARIAAVARADRFNNPQAAMAKMDLLLAKNAAERLEMRKLRAMAAVAAERSSAEPTERPS